MPRTPDERKYVIPCEVGCLRHIVGVTYFEWRHDWEDEPELYFETLHEPYEGIWGRLKAAFRFVVLRQPMGVDSTIVGAVEARRLAGVLFDYAQEHEAWSKAYERHQLREENGNG